jgi:hypothetical protein
LDEAFEGKVMKRKSTSQLFHEVDPELTVIPGGGHRHVRGRKAVKLSENPKPEMPHYEPHKVNQDDWERAGNTFCPRCHQEVVQLVSLGMSGKIKLCKHCLERKRRLIEHKRRLIDLRRGVELAKLKARRLIS